MTGTVLEGQLWTVEFVKKCAGELGIEVRTYWRHPDNGLDWNLELAVEGTDRACRIPIWFLLLKRLDESDRRKICGDVRRGLDALSRG